MRRRAGVGAIQKQKLEQERYKDKGNEIQESQLDVMTKQLQVFRDNLEEFAGKYRNEIRKNPTFRRQFQEMCASIGVDPLASNKGFWSILNIGDFYYELSVQIVEVCLALGPRTGGLISLEELRERLARSRRRSGGEISADDVLRAARKLAVLGSGFSLITLGKGRVLVQSVPGELSMDQSSLLELASAAGAGKKPCLGVSQICRQLGWEEARTRQATEALLQEGIAWLDGADLPEPTYWFPAFFARSL